MLRRLLSLRIARTLGLLCFAIAFATHRSESGVAFGGWSSSWLALLLAVTGATALSLASPLIRSRTFTESFHGARGFQAVCSDLAMLTLGLAFLWRGSDSPSDAVAELRFWGHATPMGAALAWISLVFTLAAVAAFAFVRTRGRPGRAVRLALAAFALLVIGEGAARVVLHTSPEM